MVVIFNYIGLKQIAIALCIALVATMAGCQTRAVSSYPEHLFGFVFGASLVFQDFRERNTEMDGGPPYVSPLGGGQLFFVPVWLIGRAFYDRYGFVPMMEKVHEPTGREVLRLRLAEDPSRERPDSR